MYVVGLTGGVGSGKSTVAALFAKRGITVINADSLAREVVVVGSEALKRIAEHFGADILTAQGELKRGELRRLIFAHEHERVWLEQLLHPLIAELMQLKIAQSESSYCIVESPLLLETSQHELVDRILVVDVTEATQLQRTLRRDQSDEKTIRAMIEAQMPRTDRLRRADDIIDNEQSPGILKSQVDNLHDKYLKLASEAL